MDQVVIIKRDIRNNETWRYPGRVLSFNKNNITIEAFFNRPDMQFHGILLAEGDRFVETFFTDRWFNVFAIYDCQDDRFKGLYCNISFPAQIKDGEVSYMDLALDLLVYPDGRQIILDQDEFDELPITPKIKARAEFALQELIIFSAQFLTELT